MRFTALKDIFKGIVSKTRPPSSDGSKFFKYLNRARKIGRVGGAMGGTIGGVAMGVSSVGPKVVAGSAINGLVGGVAGGVVGGFGIHLASKAVKYTTLGTLKYPKIAGMAGIGALSAYSLIKPIISSKMNRPTNPALPSRAVGPGYVTFGNSPRVSMPHNHLGATGDLTLSSYKLRHGRR